MPNQSKLQQWISSLKEILMSHISIWKKKNSHSYAIKEISIIGQLKASKSDVNYFIEHLLISLIDYECTLFLFQIENCNRSISIRLDIHCRSLLWFGLLIYFGLEVLSFHLSNSVKWDIKHIGYITERKNSFWFIRNIWLTCLVSKI